MSKKHSSGERTTNRRKFLKDVAVGSGAAAIALMTGEAGARPQIEPATAPKPEPRGYHVTQHIRDYYRTASE